MEHQHHETWKGKWNNYTPSQSARIVQSLNNRTVQFEVTSGSLEFETNVPEYMITSVNHTAIRRTSTTVQPLTETAMGKG
jgi:hypothetical protein